jgi:hypothetical protein
MGTARSAYASWDREAAVRRALQHADDSSACEGGGKFVWNFAFGSNLNPQRVRSRGMRPSSLRRGVLPGWRLLFNHTGGYGNIEQTEVIKRLGYDTSRLSPKQAFPPPDEVHGALLLFSRDDFARLALEEYAYDTVEVPVEIYEEDRLEGCAPVQFALAFKTAACAVVESSTLPSSRYIALIRDGARASCLQPRYCEWLENVPFA